MKTIYFIRHAQSEANLQDLLASRMDFPLTEQGLADAATIAAGLKKIATIDRIVSSPLLRARQTAEPIAKAFGLEVGVDERLTEQELGVFSGLTYAELDARPDYMHDRTQRWHWVPEGGGESYGMLAERLVPFFQSIESMPQGGILFVTHAVTMRMIKGHLEQTLPDYPYDIARNGEIWKTLFTRLGDRHVVESIFLDGAARAVSRA